VPPGGAGTYPFRVIWENGGGDSHVEWYTADSLTPTTRLLVNDVANGGIPAYRAVSGTAALPPYVKNVTPLPVTRQTEGAQNKVTLVLSDGTTQVNTNSITLQIDGSPQTPTITRSGSSVTVDSGALAGLRLAGETHTAVLTFNDTGTYSRTQSWAFYNIENLILPASPVTGENFDSYLEATSPATTVPPGWTVTNYTWLEYSPPAGFGVWDLSSVANDPFVNWIMITTDTVLPLEDEVLDNLKTQTINGIPLTNADNWMSNNLIFAASDGRARRVVTNSVEQPNDYAPQIQIVVSAPFNLSSVTNPVLTFSSGVRISPNHEQNTLEYSVDNGANWLPAMIMHNSATVFRNADGTYDAVKMLTNVWADVAKFPVVQDPSTRDFISAGPLGQKFGDVLATPISQALSPYIVNRNDTVAARKVEAIRLPAASRQSNVRLRMTHYGSCGWEWGIDNIAFYDIAPPAPAARPLITSVTAVGGTITVTWNNGGVLESSPSLSSPVWTPTGNSSGTFSEPVSPGANKFYRVKR
jgi:hypothetical protein